MSERKPWRPPEDRPNGYECLAENHIDGWYHVVWSRGEWTVYQTLHVIPPEMISAFAPLPPGGEF